MRGTPDVSAVAQRAARIAAEAETQACKDAGYTVEPSPEPHRWTLKRPDGSTVATDFVWQDNAGSVAWRELERQKQAA